MFTQDEDETNDPRRFRKTLVPLGIEDAERPPSLLRRMGKLFRKKNGKDGPESIETDGPGGPPEASGGDTSPRKGDADDGISGQYL